MNFLEETQSKIKAIQERSERILKEVRAQQERAKALFAQYNLDPNIYDRVLGDPSVSERTKQHLREELAKVLKEPESSPQNAEPRGLRTRISVAPSRLI
jgi:hypothetical protein